MSQRNVNADLNKEYLKRDDAKSLDHNNFVSPLSKPILRINRGHMRFQLKCFDQFCKEQQNFVTNNRCSQKPGHNHKKIKMSTLYDFDANDMPKFNDSHKESPFSTFFMSEHDKKFKLKYIVHQQKKMKEEQEKYNQQQKIYEHHKNIKKLKRKKINSQNNQKPLVNCGKQQLNNTNEQSIKIKTRYQIKEKQIGSYLCSFTRQPFPDPKNNYCFPCKSTFLDYQQHLLQQNHKLNIRKCLGEEFLEMQLDKIKTDKLNQIETIQLKLINDVALFLQKTINQIEGQLTQYNFISRKKLAMDQIKSIKNY